MIGWITFIALCSILLWKIPASKRNLWAFLFLYKSVFLWFFFYVHQKYYSHYLWDFWLIFLDACHLNDLFWQNLNDFWQTFLFQPSHPEIFYLYEQPRAFFTAKLFFFFVLLAQKNWLLSSMFALLLYLIASYHLSETLLQLFPKLKISVYAVICLPSLTFWTSGTSKEIWLLTCVWGMVVLHLQIFYLHPKALWRSILLLFFLFFILWKVKYYYAFGIAFALLIERLISFWQSKKYTKKLKWAFSLLILIMIVLLSFLHPNLHLDFFPKVLYENYQITLQASEQGSAVNLGLEPTWKSCLLNSYKGTWLGIFAPLPWEIKNLTMLLASIENTILLLLIIGAMVATRPFAPSLLKRGGKGELKLAISLLIASLLFIGLMATFLGLSSPNFGALSRYRIGFSWLLWLWVATFWENWLQRKIKNTRKN